MVEILLDYVFIIVIPDLMQNSFRCSDPQSLTTGERKREREVHMGGLENSRVRCFILLNAHEETVSLFQV